MNSKLDRVPLIVGDCRIEFDAHSLETVVWNIANVKPRQWERVITPNLHHIHLLRTQPELYEVYSQASLLLADGWPVAWILGVVRRRSVDRVAGSDLLESVLATAGHGKALVLVGGRDSGALESVANRGRAAGWNVACEPAPASEIDDETTRADLVHRVAAKADGGIVVLGLGTPKQERLASELSSKSGSGYILCLGMAINFSAGIVKRAPKWMRKYNLEWIFRIMQETRRLLPRYVRDATSLIPLLADNVRTNK